jgi:hypothetical protein
MAGDMLTEGTVGLKDFPDDEGTEGPRAECLGRCSTSLRVRDFPERSVDALNFSDNEASWCGPPKRADV